MDNEVKLRPLYLAKILFERTDEDHSLSTNDLIQILEDEYHIHSHRQTLGSDIELLQEYGMDIQVTRSAQKMFNLVSRDIDYAELKLLIDAVESAKFISKKKSVALVEKITKLAGGYKSAELKRNISVERRIKSENEHTIYIIDAINEAINQGKQIRFQYFQYNVKKERKLKFDGYWYRLSPYRLVWNGDYYYVVGYYDKYKKVISYRVDRMAGTPEISDLDSVPLPEGFDLDHYLNSMFHMFSTEREKVSLIVENECMDALIDRFGEDVETYAYDMEHFRAEVEIAVNNVFFSWIFGFGGKVEILGPEKVKNNYIDLIRRAATPFGICAPISENSVSDEDDTKQ